MVAREVATSAELTTTSAPVAYAHGAAGSNGSAWEPVAGSRYAGWQLGVKRSIDVLCAAVGLVVLLPVLVLIALSIRIADSGPALFAQERLGRDGRPFRMLKFRTMRPDAEEVLHTDPGLYARYVANDFKLSVDSDPRVTRLGRFLRRSSLDELPQLWNVLRGEMSLVGPRPIVFAELASYGPLRGAFLEPRPGLTGRWQVEGRSQVGYPDRAELDADYLRSWSIASDLHVLLRTLPTVLARRGAR